MFKGTVLAQAIGVIGSLILAKLYGDAEFGRYGLYLSIIGITAVANTWQLEHGIVTTKTEEDGRHWFLSVLGLSIGMGLLLAIPMFFLPSIFEGENVGIPFVIMAIISGVLLAHCRSFEAYLTKRKRFKVFANSKIITSLTLVGMQFILYYLYEIDGLILGSLLSLALTLIYFWWTDDGIQSPRPSPQSFKTQVQTQPNLLRYALPSSLTNAIALHIMPILIYRFFSDVEAGAYFLAMKILMSPLLLISASVAQVYFQKSNELYHKAPKELYAFTKKVVLGNIALMFVFLIGINSIGIYLLDYFFDKDWELLTPIIPLLSFLVLARSSFSPISYISIVMEKNHISFLFNIYFLIISIGACYYGYIQEDIMACIQVLSILGGLGYFALLAYFMLYLRRIDAEN